MDLIAEADLDRKAAIRDTPALIKAYLRLGGFVGRGAYIGLALQLHRRVPRDGCRAHVRTAQGHLTPAPADTGGDR